MASGFNSTPAELHDMSTHCSDTADQIQSQLTQIEGHVETLLGSWGGSAAQAFNVLMTKFHEDGAKINSALRNLSEQLQQASGEYARTEEEQHGSITSITNALGS